MMKPEKTIYSSHTFRLISNNWLLSSKGSTITSAYFLVCLVVALKRAVLDNQDFSIIGFALLLIALASRMRLNSVTLLQAQNLCAGNNSVTL